MRTVQDEQRVAAKFFVRKRARKQPENLRVSGVQVHLLSLVDGPCSAGQQEPLHRVVDDVKQIRQG